ncbi:hypothetical protein AAKU64_003140 [Undibacterium sp. GrIS 1.8]
MPMLVSAPLTNKTVAMEDGIWVTEAEDVCDKHENRYLLYATCWGISSLRLILIFTFYRGHGAVLLHVSQDFVVKVDIALRRKRIAGKV